MDLKIGGAMRAFLVFVSVLIWAGIYLTGFDFVHWLLYVPGVVTAVGGITGICVGMGIMRKLVKG